ncbi:cell division protein ZapA [Spirosoma sp. KNUC1025]|uniref:cell division protein ZapA n=1 Tax=Spirosoma sp. KNUC1025 TaxID=2894082 RepID=UPI003866514F|nr:cell division protein ZapA [Spirosoma sp. KNUC1025]
MEELSIRLKIADRTYPLRVESESEAIVREVGKLIQEQLKQYRDAGISDTQDALAMVAFDCLITKIRGEQKMQRLQQTVFDKITQLDQVVSPAIPL